MAGSCTTGDVAGKININIDGGTIGYDTDSGGSTGIALAIYDGDGWKRANYSLRMRALHIEGGDCHAVDVYEWR